MTEGAGNRMKNRQHSRLLTTVVLVAALSVALKPSFGGEPDQGSGAPLPPKVNPTSSLRSVGGTGAGMAGWALRFQWSFRMVLMQLPKRLFY